MDNNDNLLKVFIGKNYDKITTKGFNVAGFFFSMFYMFYRKMLLYGFLCILIELGLGLVFKNYYLGLILNILIGLFVNKIYIIYANKKINKIKDENQGKTPQEIENICMNKGGTSGLYLFLGIIIELFVLLLMIFVLIPLSLINQIQGTVNNLDLNLDTGNDIIIENTSPDEFNGTLIYSSEVKIKDKFTINVPNAFQDNSYDFSYDYSYNAKTNDDGKIFTSCGVKLNAVEGFSSSYILINGMHNFHINNNSTSTDIENITINNIMWSSIKIENDIGKHYYYATDKDNLVYLLEYDVQTDTDSNCEGYRESIINSIQSK